VQHERVRIRTQFGDDERDTLRHETGNEGHVVAAEDELHRHEIAIKRL
jgi:hypothetical protein